MRFVLAALVLLALQQLFWREPREVGAEHAAPPAVEARLRGRTTTEPVLLAGRVLDVSPTYGEGVRLTMSVETADGAASTGLVSVSLRSTSRRWRTGDRLELRSKLRRISGFGNFGELDWAAYNSRRGIFASAYAWQDDDVRVLPAADGAVDAIRRRFSEACERIGGQGAEILEALVIGDRTGIDAATNVAVRDAGLAHFLAISGSHMALIVALVVGAVRCLAGLRPSLLERWDVLRFAAVAGGLAVVAYGAVCGGGVSVNRSEMMALAAMVALWRGRPGDELRALGASAVVLALAMPGVGEEAGFQLSYLAVVALIADSRRQRAARREARRAGQADDDGKGYRRHLLRALHLLLEAARLTLVCWAVTSPVVAHHFQRVSLVAPLANLLAAPLVSAIVVLGIAGLLLLPLLPSAGIAAVWAGAFLSDLVVHLSAWCASLPHAATTTVAPGALLTASLTVLGLVLLLPRSRWRSPSALAASFVAVLCIGVALHERWRDDRLEVWFASVGQGDGAVVKLPGGEVWVIDTGPPGRGRMVMAPLLRRAWIGRIDVLVASHLQSDHAGAVSELLDDFEVGEIWIPDGPCETPAFEALRRQAEERGVPLRFVSTEGIRPVAASGARDTGSVVSPTQPRAGRSLQGGSDAAAAAPALPDAVRRLWPPRGAAACNANDQSLVLVFSYAGRRLLFTGDIEAAAEAALARMEAMRVDILKVPHHGSRSSSSALLLDAVQPQLAVMSLGLDNQFHFPAREVLQRYEARGVRVLRSDRDGAVHLTIDEAGVELETFRGGSG